MHSAFLVCSYMMDSCEFRTSVMNMYPGAWVIMNSGFTAMATA